MIQSPAGYQGDVRIKRYLDFYQAGYGVAMLSSGVAFSPLSLFANGEQGGWYDPSDLTTLYQDAAGTTPVTAVEQPVGRVLDKSGRGNHLSQSTAAARPVLSARVNLLTQTEDIGNAVWLLNGATKGGKSSVVMPDGSTNGQIINITAAANKGVYQNVTLTPTPYTWTVVLAAVSGTQVARLAYFDGTSQSQSSDITVTTTPTRYTWTFTGASAAGNVSVINGSANAASNIIVWGADLRPANAGVGLPSYQRVGAATDYDTTGFPLYLRGDGTDDGMSTASIDFSSTNKIGVFAGARKLSDANTGTVLQLSASTSTNNGTFAMYAPFNTGAAADYAFISKGTTRVIVDSDAFVGPENTVLTGLGDIAGPTATLRRNGIQIATSSSSQGTGNFGSYALTLGTGAGNFNGHIYGLVVVGRALTAAEISSMETWMAAKTGVTI